jgi:hypothetical protein
MCGRAPVIRLNISLLTPESRGADGAIAAEKRERVMLRAVLTLERLF